MTETFTATPVIWVRIYGVPSRVVDKFVNWTNRPVALCGYRVGLSRVEGCYAPDEAERVIAWLRENGCAERSSG